MRIVIDDSTTSDDRLLGESIGLALEAGAGPALKGTLYVGSGSAQLIGPRDPRPHVLVPLLQDRLIDPIARAQIEAADAVIFMDREEAAKAPPLDNSTIVIVLETAGSHGVLRSDTPAEGAGVARLAAESPELFERLRVHGAAPPPFDFTRVADAVAEATVASAVGA